MSKNWYQILTYVLIAACFLIIAYWMTKTSERLLILEIDNSTLMKVTEKSLQIQGDMERRLQALENSTNKQGEKLGQKTE